MNASRTKTVLVALGGFVVGAVVVAALTVVGMRSLMIVRHESRLGFDETVAELEKQVKANGWSVVSTKSMNKAMARHGVDFVPRVTLIKLCKAEYASRVLTDSRHLATMMPCTLAVYEADDGSVHVAKMNTGLMGKVFGGTVAEVMGGSVSRDEATMLASVVKP